MLIPFNNILHNWCKTNNVTLFSRGGSYDHYKCSKCGLEAHRIGLSDNLKIVGKFDEKKLHLCTGMPDMEGKKIQIIRCHAGGKIFSNLTPGSVHSVVSPPKGYFHDDRGVWVMGVGEPVKVLNEEFSYVREMKRTKLPK